MTIGKEKAKFDLEERTLKFAKDCIDLCRELRNDVVNRELIRQLIRASGSVGANYREANDSSTSKTFYHLISICRREAKESRYWLELLQHANDGFIDRFKYLIDESCQLTKIFAAIHNRKKKEA